MSFQKIVAMSTLVAVMSTGLAPAAMATEVRILSAAQLHESVQGIHLRAAAARVSMDQLLQAPGVQKQIRRTGLSPDAVRARMSMLSDAEIVRLQAQVMPPGMQQASAGMSTGAIIAIAAGGTVLIILAYALLLHEATDYPSIYY